MIDGKIHQAWQNAFDYYSHQQLLLYGTRVASIKFDIKRAKAKRFIMTQIGFVGANNNVKR